MLPAPDGGPGRAGGVAPGDLDDHGDHDGDGVPGDEVEARTRYREVLEELRTVIPGVQVLFAFLLAAPFSSGFADLDDLGRRAYGLSLVCAALAAVVLMTPAAFHRVAPRRDRGARLRLSVAAGLVGMVLVAVAMTSAVFAVGRFVFDTAQGAAAAALVTATWFGLWFVLPLCARLSDARRLAGGRPPRT